MRRRIPGVKVEMQFLENEAYKAKLPTILQSKDRPHIIYSWAGGVLKTQIEAGVLEDITDQRRRATATDLRRRRSPPSRRTAASTACRIALSQVGFLYNKELFAKANVDAHEDQELGRSARRGEGAESRGRHADRGRRRRQMAAAFLLDASGGAARRQGRRSRRRCAARTAASRARRSRNPASCSSSSSISSRSRTASSASRIRRRSAISATARRR